MTYRNLPQNLLFFSLPLIFLLGFMAGSYWQATVFRTALPMVPATTAPPSVQSPKSGTSATEDEKLAQAMEDPDFRRVHDFLMRETPMQMNLDLPSQTDTKKE